MSESWALFPAQYSETGLWAMWHTEPPLILSFPALGMERAGDASGFQIQLLGFYGQVSLEAGHLASPWGAEHNAGGREG